ncbi:MAG: hypothetical protein NQU46_03760 [Methanolinea sp.]|nr:hypothetical protein [Methanolinea sp.]
MNVPLTCTSFPVSSSGKVTMGITGATNGSLKKVDDVTPKRLTGFDLIGFGPGIDAGNCPKSLDKLLEKIYRREKNGVPVPSGRWAG